MVQIFFAVLAGILTVGAPCILPLLPILLGASVGQQNKTRPLFIALGFIVMFSLLGLSLSYIVQRFMVAPNLLRNIAIVALGLFGSFMIFPAPIEWLSSKLNPLINKANKTAQRAGTGTWGGFVLGLMLGAIWTPCAGPILGSILTLIATQTDTFRAAILLVAYSLGAAIPMVLIAYGGQAVTTQAHNLAPYSSRIQRIFGIVIVTIAVLMFFQYDLILQAKIIDLYPGILPRF